VTEERSHRVHAYERAVAACLQALVDYQMGLLDEEQLRRALDRDGVVLAGDGAWRLDLPSGTWRRDDGTSACAATPLFDAATLGRWQRGLRALQTSPLTGVAGS
jgi:hypothetical protein